MPELAEVEYYRRQWDAGIGHGVTRVSAHGEKRVFRGVETNALVNSLTGAKLLGSEAHGKQMLFRFSKDAWLGIHLGMTGSLRIKDARFQPQRHDHLVLFQARRALVFSDPRQFGRLQFHRGRTEPEWWSNLPPGLHAPAFTAGVMRRFLQRHKKLPIKAALLLQAGFPGIGNWMADEILWRAEMRPKRRAGQLSGEMLTSLWKAIRFVCRGARKHVSPNFADPPKGWLFHERWKPGGLCPICGRPLKRETIGARTTAWCASCQR